MPITALDNRVHLLNTTFNAVSNGLCNRFLFAPWIIREMDLSERDMHETMRRLYEAAKTIKGWTGQSAVAQKLHQSPTLSVSAARKVWVIGQGQGGLPDRIWTDGDYPAGVSDEYAEYCTKDSLAFIVKVRGDSMMPRYNPWEYAVIEPSTLPESQDDVLVRLASGETMIKRLLSRRDGQIRLGSYNQAEVMVYAERDITWMYYVSNPIPANKIKHWVESQEYEGPERRQVFAPHVPNRRIGAVPAPMSESDHVYKDNEEIDKKDKGEQQ